MFSFLNDLSVHQLLLLRVLLDEKTPYSDLTQDIQDLYQFPQRLEGSYVDEWRFYIKLQLVRRGISPKQVLTWLENPDKTHADTPSVLIVTEEVKARFQQYLSCLQQIEIIAVSDNIEILKTPLQNWLHSILK